MKAFGYVRVSSKGQVEGDGLTRQEEATRQYAKAHGIEVVRIYADEGISGTLANRPALAEMMLSLEHNGHGIKTVIVERLDRLARDLMVQEKILYEFEKNGFQLISTCEGDDLLSLDPTRRLVRHVLGAISQYEKQMIVLKLRAARDRKRLLNGKCEGRIGYLEACPELIEEIKKLRKKPRCGKRLTYREVAEALNSNGKRTLDGCSFTSALLRRIVYSYARCVC